MANSLSEQSSVVVSVSLAPSVCSRIAVIFYTKISLPSKPRPPVRGRSAHASHEGTPRGDRSADHDGRAPRGTTRREVSARGWWRDAKAASMDAQHFTSSVLLHDKFGRDMAEARLQGGGGGGGGGGGEKAAGAASPRSERQEAGDRSRSATTSASVGGRSASSSMDERELAATSLSACHVGSPSSRKQATGSDRVGLHPLPLPLPLEPSP